MHLRKLINPLEQGDMTDWQIAQSLDRSRDKYQFELGRLIKLAIFYNRSNTLNILFERTQLKPYQYYDGPLLVVDVNGNTALHLVMYHGSPQLIDKLLSYTSFYNIRNGKGETPFGIAISSGKNENVKKLYSAILNDSLASTIFFLDNFDESHLLSCLAAKAGNIELIEFFLAQNKRWGINSKARNNGYTLLHFTVDNERWDAMKILLNNYSADPNIEDEDGNYPLDLLLQHHKKARPSEYYAAIELLIAKGANFEKWQDDDHFRENILSHFEIKAASPLHYQYIIMCKVASNSHSEFRNKLQTEAKHKFEIDEQDLKDAGWIKLITSEELNDLDGIINYYGYYGVTYYKTSFVNNQNKVELLIAHRGTCFNKHGNVLADYQILLRKKPEILAAAKLYYDHSIALSIKHWKNRENIHVTHIGFSLGGGIAAAIAIEKRQHSDKAVTFDAPGMSYLLDGLLPEEVQNISERIINYVMPEPTVINTANKHIGEIRQIVLNKLKIPEKQFHCDYIEIGNEASMDHVLFASRSHDLARIRNSLMYRELVSWVQADNKVHLGSRPSSEDLMYFKMSNPILELICGTVVIGGQVAVQVLRNYVWSFTQEQTEAGEVGMIGIVHTRVNTISYKKISQYESKPELEVIKVKLRNKVTELTHEKTVLENKLNRHKKIDEQKIAKCNIHLKLAIEFYKNLSIKPPMPVNDEVQNQGVMSTPILSSLSGLQISEKSSFFPDDEKSAGSISRSDSLGPKQERSLLPNDQLEKLQLELSKITTERDAVFILMEQSQGPHHSKLDKKYEALSAQVNSMEEQISRLLREQKVSYVTYHTQPEVARRLSSSPDSIWNRRSDSQLQPSSSVASSLSLPKIQH